ncbi:MAG: glycosyltransferase family 4 protein [Thermodesulfobacteriota bacterium]
MPISENNSPNLTKKLKIAVLVRNFVTTGGAERYAFHISKRLTADHEVHIFCQTWDEKLTTDMTVHRIPRPLPKPSFVNLLIFSWFCKRRVDDSFDIIYSHERVQRFDVLSIHCPCYRGFLTKSQGLRKIMLWLRELTSPRGLAYLWLEKTQYEAKPGRLLIADSRMVGDDVLDNYPLLPPEYIKVAYPGVDLDEIDQALKKTDRESTRQQFGLKQDDFALLFVGTEFKRKGLDFLLQALSMIKDKKIKLLIAGGKEIRAYQDKAEQLGIAGQVSFLGKIADIYPLYIMADAFALPTLSDPCPIAPLEAMTCGTPTIMSASSYCGTAEHVQNNEAIVIQNPRDSEEIARAIEELLNQDARREYAKKGRELGKTLGWKHTTDITLEAFAQVIKNR